MATDGFHVVDVGELNRAQLGRGETLKQASPSASATAVRSSRSPAPLCRPRGEGGWGVVCTEQVELHPPSGIGPFIELRIWDDQNIPALSRIADAIHDGGALAGIEPDIADLRRWHRNAGRRSLQAGCDIVYVYAAHGLGGIHHFLSPKYNQRTAEYAAAPRTGCGCCGKCWRVPRRRWKARVRSPAGSPWTNTRFGPEGEQEQYDAGLKEFATKPVVVVGRFTSPELMVRRVKAGQH